MEARELANKLHQWQMAHLSVEQQADMIAAAHAAEVKAAVEAEFQRMNVLVDMGNTVVEDLQEDLATRDVELERLREAKGKPTGWYVLLQRRGDDWVSLGCVSPFQQFDAPDEIPEEWHVVLSIPEPDSIPEFTGW